MEKIEKSVRKSPNQEIGYFRIGKTLVSRWYRIACSPLLFISVFHIYLWYTPKTFATSGTMKLEAKKSEIFDIAAAITASYRGPFKKQSETSVIQSPDVILAGNKDLNYPVSIYIEGRVRTTEIYLE